jgi:hypothetical protein
MNKKERNEDDFDYSTGVDIADSIGLALICLCLVLAVIAI